MLVSLLRGHNGCFYLTVLGIVAVSLRQRFMGMTGFKSRIASTSSVRSFFLFGTVSLLNIVFCRCPVMLLSCYRHTAVSVLMLKHNRPCFLDEQKKQNKKIQTSMCACYYIILVIWLAQLGVCSLVKDSFDLGGFSATRSGILWAYWLWHSRFFSPKIH